MTYSPGDLCHWRRGVERLRDAAVRSIRERATYDDQRVGIPCEKTDGSDESWNDKKNCRRLHCTTTVYFTTNAAVAASRGQSQFAADNKAITQYTQISTQYCQCCRVQIAECTTIYDNTDYARDNNNINKCIYVFLFIMSATFLVV